jgi:phage shock protein A
MGILDRLSSLVKSNVNSALDKMTDPGKEIDQMIVELDENLKKARVEVTQALASEKRTEKRTRQKVDALTKDSAEWDERAQRAVLAGDDGLAKEALGRKAEIDAEKAETEKSLMEQAAYADQLTAALKAADQKVAEIKSRKETLKAEARARKTRDQLVAGVDAAEAENQLDDDLAKARHEDAASLEMERKLNELDQNQQVEDRLAALKKKLDK